MQVSVIDEPQLFNKLNRLRDLDHSKERYTDEFLSAENFEDKNIKLDNKYSEEDTYENTTEAGKNFDDVKVINKIPEKRLWQLKSKSGQYNNDSNGMESDRGVSSCPLIQTYKYVGKPTLEDNFTNSH